ncbi:MAG: Uma2 family endonuclease [Candidatus Cloacimonadota bacterium]|nr:Uma2 family endonuclease [Candidatus Cloacimonadota bacterium]
MSLAKKRKKDSYTYADYLKFPKEFKSEIIDGVIYDMSPAPVRKHQKISMKLSQKISNFLENKICEVYAAPFDVRLGEKKDESFEIKNVVQPDLSIICDQDRLDEKGCIGVPDWIIEILSPSTTSIDLHEKFDLYEKYGVKEYWLVEPFEQIIFAYTLGDDGVYQKARRFTNLQIVQPTTFEDFDLDLAEVFGVERKGEKAT